MPFVDPYASLGDDETAVPPEPTTQPPQPVPVVKAVPVVVDDSLADLGGATHQGWLEKFSIGKSTLFKFNNWKRRYFVLVILGDTLRLGYYEDSRCAKVVGVATLHAATSRLVTRPSLTTHRKAKKPGFDLCVIYFEAQGNGPEVERRLLLRADSTAVHRAWCNVFGSVILDVDVPSDHPCPPL